MSLATRQDAGGQDQDGDQPLGPPQDYVPRRDHRHPRPLARRLRRHLQDGPRMIIVSDWTDQTCVNRL